MRLVRVRAGVCAPCTHVYSPFSVFEHTHTRTYIYIYVYTHVVLVPPFLSFPLNSSFFSILLLSVRGNKRTPICPRKTKNLFHTRRRFLAFSAAPRHQIPSLFSRAFGESGAITKTQITDRLAAIILRWAGLDGRSLKLSNERNR